MTDAPYQVMPPLSADEREALKADIAERGVMVPVEYDDAGNILDGHHRVELCAELGVTQWPRLIRYGMSEPEKRRHARRLNIDRRHLDQATRRKMIEDDLRETPEASDRKIASGLGVHHSTVSSVRATLETTGEISQSKERKGRDQRTRRIVQYVDPSPEGVRGSKLTAKTILKAEREANGEARTRLQQVLSDESARLPSGRKVPVIYADPATKFLAGLGPKSTENHYKTMTTDELCALPVGDRALTDCELYIWSTVPQLVNTIKIANAWGFPDYSSHVIWDKTSPDHPKEMGPGYVFRNQHELLLRFTRGNPVGPKIKPLSIYRERKREHSRKPDYFRQMIIDMTRGLPTVELFARVDAEHPLPKGWESWGNQSAPDQPVDVNEKVDVDSSRAAEATTGRVVEETAAGTDGADLPASAARDEPEESIASAFGRALRDLAEAEADEPGRIVNVVVGPGNAFAEIHTVGDVADDLDSDSSTDVALSSGEASVSGEAAPDAATRGGAASDHPGSQRGGNEVARSNDGGVDVEPEQKNHALLERHAEVGEGSDSPVDPASAVPGDDGGIPTNLRVGHPDNAWREKRVVKPELDA